MNKRNLTLIVSCVTFISGAIFILSDDAGITANVIGYSGSSQALTAVIGLVILIASSLLFLYAINKHDIDIETLVRQNPNKHEDLTKAELHKHELEEKYDEGHHKQEIQQEPKEEIKPEQIKK